MTSRLEFCEYQRSWTDRYDRLTQMIRSGLPDGTCVEHVGSTAVLGLPSKDCIDVLVTSNQENLSAIRDHLQAWGMEYRARSFADDPGRFFLRQVVDGHRRAHIHLLIREHPAAVEMRALRDLLRHDECLREEYGRIKRELANRFPDDRAAYISGKDAFVKEATRIAVERMGCISR